MAGLVTTRYVTPGVYIGQLIRPRPGNLTAGARVPCYIGRGSRLASAKNFPIRRSFVYAEPIAFPPNAPFEATLEYQADENQNNPVRLFKGDGTALRPDQWVFTNTGTKILVNTEAYDSTASYYLDYQSVSRDVRDPVPVAELRQIKAVGNNIDQGQFQEYVDYYIEEEISDPSGDATNVNPTPTLEVPAPDGGNTSVGVVAQATSSAFLHNYNRFYYLEVTNVAGNNVTFKWTATPYCGGNTVLPKSPLTGDADITFVVNALDPAGTLSKVQLLELGIRLQFTCAVGADFVLGDKWTFNAHGGSLIEKDDRFSNTNQYTKAGTVEHEGTGTGSIAVDVTDYVDTNFNTNFVLKCTVQAGTAATFIWAQYGEKFTSGTFVYDTTVPGSETQLLADAIIIELTGLATTFVVGDTYTFKIYSPMLFYQAKDNRVYRLVVTAATNPDSVTGFVQGTYNADTPEGGFGVWEAIQNTALTDNGYFRLTDNIRLFARNMVDSNGAQQFAIDDKFSFTASNLNWINWNLNKRASDTVEPTEVLTDVNGAITGTSGTPYIILSHSYNSGTVIVKRSSGGQTVSSIEIPGSPYVALASDPGEQMTVNYTWKGNEPDPGQIYYFTASYLRPDNLYNTPQVVLSRDDGRMLLAPSNSDNHLFIMNEIAWDQGIVGAMYIQVKDADADGVYNSTDFKAAIDAAKARKDMTDMIVLGNFGSLSDELAFNVQANDPFEAREMDLWIGCPIGTPIGDDRTPDTLVYLARKTLQVYGDSPAHGTRILAPSTWAKKTIVLENGATQQVTLDGSFVAGGYAALQDSFTDPAQTILKKTLAGFDDIQTYSDPQNIVLGGASMPFLTSEGSGVFRIQEDVTVDTLAPDFNLISGSTQKQYVTKVVRREMDSAITGTVVPTGSAGQALVASVLAGLLVGLLGRGLIAPYQTDDGTPRKFDPNKDVIVIRDTADPTLYRFFYCYWIRFPIKRLFGMYVVGSQDFGLSLGS